MARILAISSTVAHGHVGLSAAAPALQALGHEVTQLPTVVLSNHPAWSHVSGQQVPPTVVRSMLDAIAANGWMSGIDAVLTGYLPNPDHVAVACEAVDLVRDASPACRIVVDPVLGDEPKGLYLADEAARAIRDSLVPRADVLTPNRFELGWLTGRGCDTLADVHIAARSVLPNGLVLVTSAPFGPDETGVAEVSGTASRTWRMLRRSGVPHGVGDVFSALIAAGLTTGAALGHLKALIAASLGADHLRIAASAPVWTGAAPLEPDPVPPEE